jgi:hypothetical protein
MLQQLLLLLKTFNFIIDQIWSFTGKYSTYLPRESFLVESFKFLGDFLSSFHLFFICIKLTTTMAPKRQQQDTPAKRPAKRATPAKPGMPVNE